MFRCWVDKACWLVFSIFLLFMTVILWSALCTHTQCKQFQCIFPITRILCASYPARVCYIRIALLFLFCQWQQPSRPNQWHADTVYVIVTTTLSYLYCIIVVSNQAYLLNEEMQFMSYVGKPKLHPCVLLIAGNELYLFLRPVLVGLPVLHSAYLLVLMSPILCGYPSSFYAILSLLPLHSFWSASCPDIIDQVELWSPREVAHFHPAWDILLRLA